MWEHARARRGAPGPGAPSARPPPTLPGSGRRRPIVKRGPPTVGRSGYLRGAGGGGGAGTPVSGGGSARHPALLLRRGGHTHASDACGPQETPPCPAHSPGPGTACPLSGRSLAGSGRRNLSVTGSGALGFTSYARAYSPARGARRKTYIQGMWTSGVREPRAGAPVPFPWLAAPAAARTRRGALLEALRRRPPGRDRRRGLRGVLQGVARVVVAHAGVGGARVLGKGVGGVGLAAGNARGAVSKRAARPGGRRLRAALSAQQTLGAQQKHRTEGCPRGAPVPPPYNTHATRAPRAFGSTPLIVNCGLLRRSSESRGS